MKTRPMVYIAGPLSKGVVALNIRKALEMAERVWDLGMVPVVPHLTTHFWNCMIPHKSTTHKKSFWMAYDFAVLPHCDAMIRIKGISIGADMEEVECHRLGIPVFRSLQELFQWKKKNRKPK